MCKTYPTSVQIFSKVKTQKANPDGTLGGRPSFWSSQASEAADGSTQIWGEMGGCAAEAFWDLPP